MNNFNAEQARELSKSADEVEIDAILEEIKQHCYGGCFEMHTKAPLSSGAISELTKRGFSVQSMPSEAVQKDGVYDRISWAEDKGKQN